jgi:glycosyltransferase involved in cell wall biosynthesis
MKFRRPSRTESLLLVGVWANRNWILGNWIKEINLRNQDSTKIHWIASVFAQKHFWEKFVKFPIPQSGAYFFSYPSIFESYIKSNSKKFENKSIVNYTHNMDELGSLEHQARMLNLAHSVHFNCSRDMEALVKAGLESTKIRLVYGAVDSDCVQVPGVPRDSKTILLASQYSERKGVGLLPEIVKLLPEWKFIILGRGWENFLAETALLDNPNIDYQFFDKQSRNLAMSRASIFLSLSKLEGGPVPLIESMSMGVIPVATDTGFARDVITDGQNGRLILNPPTPKQVVEAILGAAQIGNSPHQSVKHLTWDRISKIVMEDAKGIWDKE